MKTDRLWPAELEIEVPSSHGKDFRPKNEAQEPIKLPLPVLHPGQVKIERDLGDARFGIVMAGRRAGKTIGPGIRWILEGLALGETVAWLAPTNKIFAKAWRDLKRLTRPAGARVWEQEHRIVLGNGELEGWSFEAGEPALSRAYDRMVIDEAGIVRDLMIKWTTNLRATLIDRKGKARFLGTPRGMGSGFVQLSRLAKARKAGWGFANLKTIDNPFIDPTEVEEARLQMPPEIFQQEFEGIPTDASLNPFGLDAIGKCIIPALSTGRDEIWGWDFARAEDYTVGVALDIFGQVCRFERWNKESWTKTRADIKRITGPTYAMGDSTGIGDVIVEDLQRDGVRMEPFIFSKPSKQMLMARLAAAIQQGIVKFPDGILRTELEVFEYQTFGGRVRYTAPTGLHDDCVMALALAVHGYDRLGLALRAANLIRPGVKPMDNWDPEVLARAALESRRIKERPALPVSSVPVTAMEFID